MKPSLIFQLLTEFNLLMRYIHSVHEDVEAAKSLLELSLRIRNKSRNIFFDRDPMSESAQNAFDILNLIPLPTLTKDGYKLFIFGIANSDPELVRKL